MTEQEKKEQESIYLRGICATLQAMKFPSFENLDDLLKKVGLKLVREKPQL